MGKYYQSNKKRIVLVLLMFLVVASASAFFLLKKYRADTTSSSVLYYEGFETSLVTASSPSGSSSSSTSNSSTTTSTKASSSWFSSIFSRSKTTTTSSTTSSSTKTPKLIANTADSDALAGKGVLRVDSQDRKYTETCSNIQAPIRASKVNTAGAYTATFAMKGKIEGQSITVAVNWKEKIDRKNVDKTLEKTIKPADIDGNNWSIFSFDFDLPSTLVKSSVYITPLRECKGSKFIGDIDSLQIARAQTQDIVDNASGENTVIMTKKTNSFSQITDKPIYSVMANGNGAINSKKSLVKVIVVDKGDKQYQSYENSGILTVGSFILDRVDEETSIFNDGIRPKDLFVYTNDVSFVLNKIILVTKKENVPSNVTVKIETRDGTTTEIQSTKKLADLARIASYTEVSAATSRSSGTTSNLKLGETGFSKLSYNDKRQYFPNGVVPNLQGMEYYNGGNFNISTNVPDQEDESLPQVASTDQTRGSSDKNLPEIFDWRRVHNQNWLTPVTQQVGGTCWAWAATAVLESAINLKYNDHLDKDLSETYSACLYPGGGVSSRVFKTLTGSGIMPLESMMPTTIPLNCSSINWPNGQEYGWKISSYNGWSLNPPINGIRQALITKGPMSFGIIDMYHQMELIGYVKNPKLWIFKNSWGGTWGVNEYDEPWDRELGWDRKSKDSCASKVLIKKNEANGIELYKDGDNLSDYKCIAADGGYGYFSVPWIQRHDIYYVENPYTTEPNFDAEHPIKCLDKDGDGYYNWGVGAKPATCPANVSDLPDCDDSNSTVGGRNANMSCTQSKMIDRVKSFQFVKNSNESYSLKIRAIAGEAVKSIDWLALDKGSLLVAGMFDRMKKTYTVPSPTTAETEFEIKWNGTDWQGKSKLTPGKTYDIYIRLNGVNGSNWNNLNALNRFVFE